MKTRVRSLSLLLVALVFIATRAEAGGRVEIEFDPANFSDPLTIDNPFWPLVEGTTFVYRTASGEDCEVNDVEVTSNTKTIEGVTTREVRDLVWQDDDCDGGRDTLLENTLDWYAQDDAGNIWYFGETTSEATEGCVPEPGQCDTSGSWEAGADVANIGSDAEAGILILADPNTGDSYQQEFYEGEAEDQGKVLKLNGSVSLTLDNQIDPDDYTDCMVTKETSPLEPGSVEHKTYCPGVGLLSIEALKGKNVVTELVEIQD